MPYTARRMTVLRGGFYGRYLATSGGTGHLIYMRQNTLFAVPFDLNRRAVTGGPQPVLEDVNNSGSSSGGGSGNFDFSGPSGPGTFAYVRSEGGLPWSIFWLDSTGRTEPLQTTPANYHSLLFSPDGKRLAFGIATSVGRSDIWVKDLDHDTTSRFTSLGFNGWPIWTPDGKYIVFASGQAAPGLYWVRADAAGEPQRLTDGQTRQAPYSFSPDGKYLAGEQLDAAGRTEIWTAPVEGDRDHPRLGKAEPFLRAASSAAQPEFSPDGRWLAYSSDETGRYEVYVRPFPGPGGKSPISSGGGQFPIWSRNGRELFYFGPDQRIMVASYTAKAGSFEPGKPQVWSQKRLGPARGVSFHYALAADGKRFAVVLYPGGAGEPEQKPSDSITILLNFFDYLRQRVPAGGK